MPHPTHKDSREEILKKVFDKHENRILDYPQINSKEGVLEAMSEYAEQIAIEFSEWEINNTYDFNSKTGKWYDIEMLLYPQEEITTKELFTLFLKQYKQK